MTASLLHFVFRNRSAAFIAHIWAFAFTSTALWLAIYASGKTIPIALYKESQPTWSIDDVRLNIQSHDYANAAVNNAPHVSMYSPNDSWVTVIWIVGTAYYLLRIVIGSMVLSAIARRSSRIAKEDFLLARVLASTRGKAVEIRLSKETTVPMSFGLFNPYIILPSDAGDWSESRLKAVVRHELAHVRRRDYITIMLARFVAGFCWYNPVVWTGLRKLRQCCELAADDFAVLEMPLNTYAKELLDLLRDLKNERNFVDSLSMLGDSKSSIRERFASLMSKDRDRRALSRKTFWIGCMISISFSFGFASLRIVGATEAESQMTFQILSIDEKDYLANQEKISQITAKNSDGSSLYSLITKELGTPFNETENVSSTYKITGMTLPVLPAISSDTVISSGSIQIGDKKLFLCDWSGEGEAGKGEQHFFMFADCKLLATDVKSTPLKLKITLAEVSDEDYKQNSFAMDKAVREGNLELFKSYYSESFNVAFVQGQPAWASKGVITYVNSSKNKAMGIQDGPPEQIWDGLNFDFNWKKNTQTLTTACQLDIPSNIKDQLENRHLTATKADWDIKDGQVHGFWLGESWGWFGNFAKYNSSLERTVNSEVSTRTAVFITNGK